MSDKKYYWIKLKDSFMTSDTVDFLMGQKNGANYVVLYQMLCLKTANTDGELGRQLGELLVPYDAAKIVRDCKYFDFDTVVVALGLYKKLGLVYEQENGILKIANFDGIIGSEGEAAERMRQVRARQKAEVKQLPEGEHGANNVRTVSKKEKVIQKEKKPERDIEQELELETDLDTDQEKEKDIEKNTVCQSDRLNSLDNKTQFYLNWLLKQIDGVSLVDHIQNEVVRCTFRTIVKEVALKEVSQINGNQIPGHVILRAFQYLIRPEGQDDLCEMLGQIELKWKFGEVKNRYAYTVSTLYNTCLNNGWDGWDA